MSEERKRQASGLKQNVMVLVCAGLRGKGKGLYPDRLAQTLEENDRGVKVLVIEDLCEGLAGVSEVVVEHRSSGLVLAVCSKGDSEIELFSAARKAKLDPFSIPVVPLGTYCAGRESSIFAAEKAALLLKASVARARAFEGTIPASVKASFLWDAKMTRRSIFRLPPLRYEPVPAIDPERCAAQDGCRACAEVCPHTALSVSEGGAMTLDKHACTGCGACLTACPESAIGIPGHSLEELEAELSVLLSDPSDAPKGRELLFLCSRSLPGLEDRSNGCFNHAGNWLPVEVPCLGMVSSGWIFQPLYRGASRVGLLPCGRDDCRFGNKEVLEGRVGYCRKALALLGDLPDRVQLWDSRYRSALELPPLLEERRDGAWKSARNGSFLDRRSEGRALVGLARKLSSPADLVFEHPYAALGDVRLNGGCTACGACAEACPTKALFLERGTDGVTLCFDAHSCVACEKCSQVCPENVLEVKRGIDLRRLREGKSVLHRFADVTCKRCGGPIASSELLKKITALIGSTAIAGVVTSYCISCRASSGALVGLKRCDDEAPSVGARKGEG